MTNVPSIEVARRARLRPIEDVAARDGHRAEPARALWRPRGEDRPACHRGALGPAEGPLRAWSPPSRRRRSARARRRPPSASPRGCRHIGRRATDRHPPGRRWGRRSASRAARPAAATARRPPSRRFNLHLTGDMHAVTAAHNTLAAIVDNHLHHGNELGLDLHAITWRRVLDVNDRALRNIVIGLGTRQDGVPRADGLRHHRGVRGDGHPGPVDLAARHARRLGRIVVGYTTTASPVTAEQLRAAGAMAVIMRDAHQAEPAPDAREHPGRWSTPGRSATSPTATRRSSPTSSASTPATTSITEAGFGADMGAERFFNIKCRVSGLVPDAAVVVTTVRALKAHSGEHRIVAGRPLPAGPARGEPRRGPCRRGQPAQADRERPAARRRPRWWRSTPSPSDHASEYEAIREIAASLGVRRAVCTHFADGGSGATELAEAVAEAAEEPREFRLLYPSEATLAEKIETIATRVYGADGVDYSAGRPRASSTSSRTTGSAGCRCASPRPTCRSPRIPELKGAPTRLAAARCGRCAPRSAPGSSTPSAATCGRCRASASNPAADDRHRRDGEIVGLY